MSTLGGTASAHILLIDDERLVISTLSLGLKQAGYRVSTVESAEEAEAQLASGEHPDLAILDIRMPGQDGLYLAQRLHELDHIPFLMFSAYTIMVEQATRYGALELVKPRRATGRPLRQLAGSAYPGCSCKRP
jgi:response regulator NasT